MRSGDDESSGLFVNFASDDETDISIPAPSTYHRNNNNKLFSLSTPSNKETSSLVLGTTSNRYNAREVTSSSGNSNFYSLSTHNIQSAEETTSQSNSSVNNNNNNNTSSYLSLRTKLKAVQEKYRKSSMSDKIRSKFTKPGRNSIGKISSPDLPGNLDGMSKFLSYSHGALADLDDYTHIHQQHSHSQQPKRRNECTKEHNTDNFSTKSTDISTVALVEPPPHSVSSQSSSKSSNFSHPSTPRTRPDFDEMDSGILNEIEEVGSAESLSSGSDSGFYPTGNEERRNTVRRNNTNKTVTQPTEGSPQCSRCSIHSDGGSSYEECHKEEETAGNLNLKERGRTSRGVTRRHSRASSVDRREIFTKYVARGSEHSVAILPYASHDPGEKNSITFNQQFIMLFCSISFMSSCVPRSQ